MGMSTYAAVIAYQGSDYCGWQRQSHAPSIQATLEQALSTIANHPITVFCAGRTDAGVHATAQVVHFQSDADRTCQTWLKGVNAKLPAAIKMRSIDRVNEAFHARFDAQYRRYNYIIDNHTISHPYWSDLSLWCPYPLDASAMNQALTSLIGEHDFSSFRAAQCQSKTPFRYIEKARCYRHGHFIIVDIQGNAFLHHMVRNIVGSLIEIGQGRQSVDWLGWLLTQKDRRQAGKTVEACGLHFVGVGYDQPIHAHAPVFDWFAS